MGWRWSTVHLKLVDIEASSKRLRGVNLPFWGTFFRRNHIRLWVYVMEHPNVLARHMLPVTIRRWAIQIQTSLINIVSKWSNGIQYLIVEEGCWPFYGWICACTNPRLDADGGQSWLDQIGWDVWHWTDGGTAYPYVKYVMDLKPMSFRNWLQRRFGVEEKITGRYMGIFISLQILVIWALLWGVIRKKFSILRVYTWRVADATPEMDGCMWGWVQSPQTWILWLLMLQGCTFILLLTINTIFSMEQFPISPFNSLGAVIGAPLLRQWSQDGRVSTLSISCRWKCQGVALGSDSRQWSGWIRTGQCKLDEEPTNNLPQTGWQLGSFVSRDEALMDREPNHGVYGN